MKPQTKISILILISNIVGLWALAGICEFCIIPPDLHMVAIILFTLFHFFALVKTLEVKKK